MRDFADQEARPFSQAKHDDLVNTIRDVIAGKGNPNADGVIVPPEDAKEEDDNNDNDSDELDDELDDEKDLDKKPRAYRDAVKRITARKVKKNKKKEE